jgi:hypothetical protein
MHRASKKSGRRGKKRLSPRIKPMQYTYCFVRKDIPIAAQIVQTAHACLQKEMPKDINSIVLFEVKNEDHLIKVHEYLMDRGIDSYMFFEPDYDMGYTAIATEPISEENRDIFKRFKMWS